ncbi:MAG: ribonuclease HI [Caldimicrobium sp.]
MSERENEIIEIYTDGCSLGNPGPGGYAVLIKNKEREVLLSGSAPYTTNNRMELLAVIKGLSYFKEQKFIKLYTDSEYVLKGSTEWLPKWKLKGYKTSDGKPVKNKDLWEELERWKNYHKVVFIKVPAHSGHPENERVDKIAKNEAKRWKKNF